MRSAISGRFELIIAVALTLCAVGLFVLSVAMPGTPDPPSEGGGGSVGRVESASAPHRSSGGTVLGTGGGPLAERRPATHRDLRTQGGTGKASFGEAFGGKSAKQVAGGQGAAAGVMQNLGSEADDGGAAPRFGAAPDDDRRQEAVDLLAKQPSAGASGKAAKERVAGSQSESVPAAALGATLDEHGLVLSVPLEGTVEAQGSDNPSMPPAAQQDLVVDPNNKAVEFQSNSLLAFPAAGVVLPEGGTISLEIEPNWNGADQGDNSFVQVAGNDVEQGPLSIRRRGKFLRVEWMDQDGLPQGTSISIGDWKAGEPHTVTAAWGEGVMSVYVDGKQSRAIVYQGEVQVPADAMLYLGSRTGEQIGGANARLRNLRVYDRPLAPQEVQLMRPTPRAGTG
jgi:hypothetical protein